MQQIIERRQRAEGFEAQEVLSALMLLRKNIRAFAQSQDILRSPIDVNRVMELNRHLLHFSSAVHMFPVNYINCR